MSNMDIGHGTEEEETGSDCFHCGWFTVVGAQETWEDGGRFWLSATMASANAKKFFRILFSCVPLGLFLLMLLFFYLIHGLLCDQDKYA